MRDTLITPGFAVVSPPRCHSRLALLTLMVAVVTIPAQTVVVIEGFGTLTRVLGFVAALATLVDCLRLHRLRRPVAAHAAMGAFFLWNAATLLWTANTGNTLTRLWLYCQISVFVWVVHEFSDSETYRRAIMWSYVAGALVASIFVFRAYSMGIQLNMEGRYTATGSDPNDLALSLVIAVPFTLHLAVTVRSAIVRFATLASIAIPVGAILLTGSRGGLLALVASAIVIVMYFSTPRARIMSVVFVGALICLGYIAVDALPANLVKRFADIPSEISHGSMAQRRILWQVAVDVFLERPVIGSGAGAFSTRAGEGAGMYGVAHNTYLSVAAELGLVGVLLLVLIIAGITKTVRRGDRSTVRLWLSVLAAWGVGVCSLTWEPVKVTWLIFGLFAGCGGALIARPAMRRRIVYASTANRIPTRRWGR